MALQYPEDTIWFVQASSTDGQGKSEGSAVAIRLRKAGEPLTTRTCLLTCAHVIRGRSADGEEGFGRIQSEIRVWAPGSGYAEGQAIKARIDARIKPLSDVDVPADERRNAAEDWVVLEILDPQAAAAGRCVNAWAESTDTGPFEMIGYPGGDESLSRGIVTPTRSPQSLALRDEFQGVLRLTGDATRPGNSGGGVFTADTKRFAGLHRARTDATLQLHVVAAVHISGRLLELGFEARISVGSSGAETAKPIPVTPRWNVDAIPIDWSQSPPRELEKLLVDTVESDTAILLAKNSGVPLGGVNTNSPPRQFWRKLLEAANAAGCLRKFLEAIANDEEFAGIATKINSFLPARTESA